jgi:hypothetical protein
VPVGRFAGQRVGGGTGLPVGAGSFVGGSGRWVRVGFVGSGSSGGAGSVGFVTGGGSCAGGAGGTTGAGGGTMGGATGGTTGAAAIRGTRAAVVGAAVRLDDEGSVVGVVSPVEGAGPSAGSTGGAGTDAAATGTVATPAIAARLVTGATPVAITSPSAAVAVTTKPSRECAAPGRLGRCPGERTSGSISEVSGSGHAESGGGGWGITRA